MEWELTCKGSGAYVKLAPADNTAEFEKSGEPSANPQALLFWNKAYIGHSRCQVDHFIDDGAAVLKQQWLVGDVLSAQPDQADRLHVCVRIQRVAREFRQAFHAILAVWKKKTFEILDYPTGSEDSFSGHDQNILTWKLSIIAAMLVIYSSVTILLMVWKANSTMASSLSDAAKYFQNIQMLKPEFNSAAERREERRYSPKRKTQKMFFHPDLILSAWLWTICVTQRTTMSRIVGERLRFMICSKGLPQ